MKLKLNFKKLLLKPLVQVRVRSNREIPMTKKLGVVTIASLVAIGLADENFPKQKPLSIGALSEFGQFQGGRYGNSTRFKKDWVDHSGAFITQSVDVSPELAFNVGIGGLFQYQKREIVQANWGGTQYKNFFVGPTVADMVYTHPLSETSQYQLQFGLFPYKYNESAYNLGEYLFRSGPYPTHIMTGGYAFVNNTSTYLQGLRAGYSRGNFSSNLYFTTETTTPTLYDFSLAGIAKYKTSNGLVEILAGVNAKRILPVHPSQTTSKQISNAYFEKNGKTWTGSKSYYNEHIKFYKRRAVELGISGLTQDSVNAEVLATQWKADFDSVGKWIADTTSQPDYKYYTLTGTVLMGGFTLDLKQLFSHEVFGPNDLKLYGEIALLGVQNYPIFYEKRSQRMPIMAGINLPGFKFIDLISVQYEYFNSPFMNSYSQTGNSNGATPTIPEGDDKDRSAVDFNDIATKDNSSWSVLVKKELTKGVWMSGQVARDHARTVSIDSWFGPGLEPTEIMGKSNDWYWMFQLSMGI